MVIRGMVLRGVATELCCLRYGDRGMMSAVFNLGQWPVGTEVSYLGRTELMKVVRTCSSLCRAGAYRLTSGGLSPAGGATPAGRGKARRAGLFHSPPPSAAGSETARSCTGCPLHLPTTSGINTYGGQPTRHGCACPVGATRQDPAPPVMQDVRS